MKLVLIDVCLHQANQNVAILSSYRVHVKIQTYRSPNVEYKG